VKPSSLDADLAALANLSSAQLHRRWAEVTGKVLPKVSPSMLRLALAWELQAKVHGGLSSSARVRLDQLARAKTLTRPALPGTRLMREWNGKLHVVTIGEDKVIRWDGREWRSLSVVARAITGTRWSGPAFFGLKHKRKAA
jgi:hypothetical protein